MNKVLYDLRQDEQLLRDIEEASLHTDRGLKLTHGVVGSEQWWKAIETGEIPMYRITGTIVEISRGPMGDWPVIHVRSDSDGNISSWSTGTLLPESFLGRPIVIEYVEQEAKKPPFPDYRDQLPIRIMIPE